jgi:hypothetical protein
METNSAAPSATRAFVRSPAVCWRNCRSSPMTMPIARAARMLKVNDNNGMLAILQTG